MMPVIDQQAAGQQQAGNGPRRRERLAQVGELVGDEQARGQAAVHGQAAEQGRRHDVHVPGTGSMHRAGGDGAAPDQRRQQVSCRGSEQQRENVLPHAQVSPPRHSCRTSTATLARARKLLTAIRRLDPSRPWGFRCPRRRRRPRNPCRPYRSEGPRGRPVAGFAELMRRGRQGRPTPAGARPGPRGRPTPADAERRAWQRADVVPFVCPCSAESSAAPFSEPGAGTSSPVTSAATSRSRSIGMAPARSSRGTEPVRSMMVDATPPGQGPPSRYTATESPSCSIASSAVVAAGLAGDVRAAHRHRAGPLQQVKRDRVQWHAHRHRAAGVPQIPGQRRAGPGDQGQAARPELVDQVLTERPHVLDQRGRGADGTDEHRGRHVPAAPLGRQEPADRPRRERVRADAVDRVGRQDDQFALLTAATAAAIPASRCCGSEQS